MDLNYLNRSQIVILIVCEWVGLGLGFHFKL